MKTFQKTCFATSLGLALLATAPVQAQLITVGTQTADANELASFQLINRFRADPRGELGRMLDNTNIFNGITASSTPYGTNGTAWSAGFWASRDGPDAGNVGLAMDFFQVNPGALKAQWDALPAAGVLHPLAWNGNLGQSAQGYAQIVANNAGATANPHVVAPYSTFSFQRYIDAGYVNGTAVGENIAPNFANNMPYQHAGFAVDWGFPVGAPGIQNPAGHRDSMLSSTFTEIGIGVVDGWGAGNTTQVQHLGRRQASFSEYAWGYVYTDSGDSTYTYGEGLQGVEVRLGDLVGTTNAQGGFMLPVQTLADGAHTVEYWLNGVRQGAVQITIGNAGLYAASFAVTPVPEAGTWALMLVGLASVGAVVRRRGQH